MGNAPSKVKHEARICKRRSQRRSSQQRGCRRSRGESRCWSKNDAHPSSRCQGSTTSSSSSKPNESVVLQMPPTLYEHRLPRTSAHSPSTHPLCQHRNQQRDFSRRRFETPPRHDGVLEIDDSDSESWLEPAVPHAPLPPNWDPRFYAGLPCKHSEDAQQPPRRRRFDRRHRYAEQHRSPPVMGDRLRGEKTYVDPRDPYWLGVRVALVDDLHLHRRLEGREPDFRPPPPRGFHAAAQGARTRLHVQHSTAEPFLRGRAEP